jgi:glycosyltransferase involved in cell wall biosynthesis
MNVTFLCDYAEEGWPSMDLVGTLLPEAVGQLDPTIEIERLQPPAPRWFGRAGDGVRIPPIRERLFNRYVYYPGWLRRRLPEGGVFHVLDHSYAHLVHQLPGTRTVVTCHDLDAFACVMEPASLPQPWLFRRAVSRTMRGLQEAAAVVCVSEGVRDALVQAGVAPRARTFVVPNGIHPAFASRPRPEDEAEADRLLGGAQKPDGIDLLHVSIPVARKRIDVALHVLRRLGEAQGTVRLIRAGGALPGELRDLARRLGVLEHVIELPFLSPGVLAAVYRRSNVLLVTSDREGFALPIVESLACGTAVVANDLPVLRQTGGCVARYCHTTDLGGWCHEIRHVLSQSPEDVRNWRARAQAHAARFSWHAAAQRLVPLYRELDSR